MKNIKSISTIKLLTVLFISTFAFTACSNDDDHDEDHEHGKELITTVTYTLTNGSDIVTLTYQDLDGEGGNVGTYNVSGPLTASTTYTGVLKLENETEDPAENITEEIEEEGDEHEFFFASSVTGLTITKTDVDADGNPLGIETSLTTSAASSGTLTIVLKHEPTKPNDGTVDGSGGSAEVDITFNISVQ
ncbi:type 1 periplasmic binding fold superfamily protein [uncultured Polaribacter sp.]|uniref:type 1 periplasmic binding fold superfamily protein n=1 Tax=uncultured Polaribacter sp. TaxID=174711 RepID=UPI002612F2C2|nr:type 1 periplasmic binding fold superfamily protein [uncultured Polaribacter sp.]